jgi:hypothetical protein
MKLTVLAVALVLVAGPAMAREVRMPPVLFDHEPLQDYRVLTSDQATVERMCANDLTAARRTDYGARVLGCTRIGGDTIWVVKGLSPETRRKVLRHEKAHLNGWYHR